MRCADGLVCSVDGLERCVLFNVRNQEFLVRCNNAFVRSVGILVRSSGLLKHVRNYYC